MAQPLNQLRLIGYALPALPMSAMLYVVLTVLPAFYANHTTLTLTAIGSVLLITRLFDAFTDPVIGFLSDQTRSVLGPRKPWMVAGALLSAVAVYFLFGPPAQAGGPYLLFWLLTGYLAWTMISIPYQAWGSELTRDYDQRSRLFAYSGITGALGPLLFLILPLLPIFPSTEITPDVLRVTSYVIMCALPVAVGLCILTVPRGAPVAAAKPSLRSLGNTILRNGPLQYFVAVFMIGGLAGGIYISLIFIYLDSYLQIGNRIPLILLCWSVTHVAFVPLWLRIVSVWGKTRSLAVSWAISTVLSASMAFVSPGPDAFIPILILVGLRGIVNAADTMIPAAIFADIIDYDVLISRSNQAGNLYSFFTLMNKFNGAIGGSIGFILLGLFSFSVEGGNDLKGSMGILITLFVIPTILSAIGCFLMWRFPIDARRQDIIKRRIESRALRLGVAHQAE